METCDLKKLKRVELVELLLEQSREIDRLQEELDLARARLEERRLMLDKAGSIAEAALLVNRVFEAAQKASEQYLENIKMLHGSPEAVCAEMGKASKAKAEQIIADAEMKRDEMLQEAILQCAEMREKAKADSQAYWDAVTGKLRQLCHGNAQLQQLLGLAPEKTGAERREEK